MKGKGRIITKSKRGFDLEDRTTWQPNKNTKKREGKKKLEVEDKGNRGTKTGPQPTPARYQQP